MDTFEGDNNFGVYPMVIEPVPAEDPAPTMGSGLADVEIPPEYSELKKIQAFNATHPFPPTMLPPTSIPTRPQQFRCEDIPNSNGPFRVSGGSLHRGSPTGSADSGYYEDFCPIIPQATLPTPSPQCGYEGMLDPNGPLVISGGFMLAESRAGSEESGYHAELGIIPQVTLPNASIQVSAPVMAAGATKNTKSTKNTKTTKNTKSTSKRASPPKRKSDFGHSPSNTQKKPVDGRTTRRHGLGVRDPKSYDESNLQDLRRRLGSLINELQRKETSIHMQYEKMKVEFLTEVLLKLGTRACTHQEQAEQLRTYENGRGKQLLDELEEFKKENQKQQEEAKNKYKRSMRR
jgi:hypothetical protein